MELALICDLRIVEQGAVMGLFCRRWGVPLIDGGTVRLQAIVGFGRASDFTLTGRPVGATEALDMGLVSRAVLPGMACRLLSHVDFHSQRMRRVCGGALAMMSAL